MAHSFRILNRAGVPESVQVYVSHLILRLTDVYPVPFPQSEQITVEILPYWNFVHTVWSSEMGNTDMRRPHIRISDETLHVGMSGNGSMPVGKHIDALTYAVHHEFGHVEMPRSDAELSRITAAWRMMGYALSTYGQSAPAEGYAEAFTEWTLSGGKTGNAAALTYASLFGWPDPLPLPVREGVTA